MARMFMSGSTEHVKEFDIGQFVRSYDSLKLQLQELKIILHSTDSLRRWEVPPVTLLFCVFVITLCISFPELLMVSCLFPIPLIFLATGMKHVSQGEKKDIRNIVVMAVESDEQKLVRKKEAIAESTKDLQRFIRVLCELQSWFDKVHKKLNCLQNIFYWDDPQLTLRFLGCIFALMFLVILVPLYLIILVVFLVVFFYNDAFKLVVSRYLTSLKVYSPEKNTAQNLDHSFDDDVHDNDDDVHDNDHADQSDHSLFDDDDESSSSSDFEDVTRLSSDTMVKEKASRSIVSHLSKYRKLRQELNKGNCAACQVAFSSLLTRRKYCRRCGHDFCSKCCRRNVKKAALGATAPGARDKRVLVCNTCYSTLRGATKAPD